MIGLKFGKWTVVGEIFKKKYNPFVECKCDCGTIRAVNVYDLKSGRSTNCGCQRRKTCRDLQYKHGLSNSRLDRILSGMITRCTNPKSIHYKNYGGRGIKVCEEWMNNRKAFFEWALNNGYDDNLTIDRKDNDKGYSPDNCRWVTKEFQNINKRRTIFVEINGERKCLKDWCKEINIPYSTITKKVRKGEDPKKLVMERL